MIAPKKLESPCQNKNQKDNQDYANEAPRSVAPIAAMQPCRNHPDQDQDDQKDGADETWALLPG